MGMAVLHDQASLVYEHIAFMVAMYTCLECIQVHVLACITTSFLY